ncbi:ABC transporter permease [Dermacoccaceae bacterium W4C1]
MRRAVATARRVATQILHDRRSLAILVVLPSALMWLFTGVFADSPATFDRVGPQMLGIFPFVVMFLLTSVTMVRERTSGTLERLMTTPLGKGELIAGYALAFGAAALIQAGVTSAVSLWLLGLDVGSPALVVLFAVVDALLGTALGLAMSALARTEFQAVQFMPLVVIPQLLLCGLLAPREQMSEVLSAVSEVLPMSFAADAFSRLTTATTLEGELSLDLLVLVGFTGAALGLGALTLRRRTS